MTSAQRSEQRTPQRSPMRRRYFRSGENIYDLIDLSQIPEGMEYAWKRVSMMGEEDKQNVVVMDRNGWEPVPADRHPELAGRKATAGQQIVLGGLMLCELPKEYTEEAEQDMKDRAVHQVASQARKLKIENQIGSKMSLKRTYVDEAAQYEELE